MKKKRGEEKEMRKKKKGIETMILVWIVWMAMILYCKVWILGLLCGY